MKFLVSVPSDKPDETWTGSRVPVVPCFPSQHTSAFLCVGEWKLSHYAEVAEIDDDPDAMAALLAEEYKGLPASMHEAYVMRTFEVAYDIPVGTRLRVFVSQDTATIVKPEGTTVSLWTSKPGL